MAKFENIEKRNEIIKNSSKLLVSTKKTEEIVNNIMSKILDYYTAERIYIFEIDYKNKNVNNTFEVCSSNIKPRKNTLQNLPMYVIDFWMNEFYKNDYISILNFEMLEENYKKMFTAQGVESIIAIPFFEGKKLKRFISIENFRKNGEDIGFLYTTGNMIFSKIKTWEDYNNVDLTKLIAKNKQLEAIINNVPIGICLYSMDIKTKKITPLKISKGYEAIVGLSVEEQFIKFSENNYHSIHKDDVEKCRKNIENALKRKGSLNICYRYYNNKEKKYKWIKVDGICESVNDKEVLFYVSYMDVDKKKREENLALKKYKEKIAMQEDFRKNTMVSYLVDLEESVLVNKIGESKIFKNLEEGYIDYEHKKMQITRFIVKQEDVKWIQKMKPEFLIQNFKSGKSEYERLIKYNINNKTYWYKNAISVIKHPITDHFMAICNNYDMSEKVKQESFVNSIVGNEYDVAMMIDLTDDSYVMINRKDKELVKGLTHGKNFFEDSKKQISIMEKYIATEMNYSMFEKENLINILESEKSIQKVVELKYLEKTKYKCITMRHVNEKEKLVSFLIKDITDVVEKNHLKNNQIKNAFEMARIASESQSENLSKVSHDMRTPINGILGLSKLAIESDNIDEVKDYVSKIAESSKYLSSLINDTLDMNKMKSGNIVMKKQLINIDEFFEKIGLLFGNTIGHKQINFKIIMEDIKWKYIISDKLRLKQIFNNIISNSVKFTDIGGNIIIRVENTKNENNRVFYKFDIEDTGIGMTKEYLQRVFEPFSQENMSDNCKYEGTGIGMTIVKNLVEVMGGSINIKSEKNKGTSVTIYLSFEKAEQEKIEKKEIDIDSNCLKDKKILLCEDQKINEMIATKLLMNKGAIVEVARNGVEGVELARSKQYNLILMDIRMPVMDGLTACEKIRYFDSEVPIIALSANAYMEDIKKSLSVGMNDHIVKPIVFDELYSSIAKHII